MKKEVLIAIFIGFTLGLIITVGLYTARKSLNRHETIISPQASGQPDSPTTNNSTHVINLTSPADYSVIDHDNVRVTGITSPNALIASLTSDTEVLSSADSQGNFSLDVPLSVGENILQLSSFLPSGEEATASLSLIYSSVNLSTPDPMEDNHEN